jgi:thioredoxin 1
MKKLLVLNENNFREEVFSPEIPILVDFWASWCPPCKMVEPVIEELAEEFDGKVKIAKINVDHNPKIATQYSIQGVPTFIIFNKGKERARCVGAQSKQQLKEIIKKVIEGIKVED